MTKQLIIFGDQTAAEMEAVANEVYSSHFSHIMKCYVNAVDLTLVPDSEIPDDPTLETHYSIGVLDLNLRLRIEQMCESKAYQPCTLIHPSAYVASTARIGKGCFIAPHVAIGIDANLGDHSIVHFHSSIGHGARIGRHCAILPGARISGRVTLENGVLIGSNAFIFQGTKIGEGAKIDALTYVKDEVPARRVISVRR